MELYERLCQVNASEDLGEGALSVDDIRNAMAELDTYNDGQISFEEFKALVMAALQFLYQKETNQN